jgi:murein DD-endopeptidase MepM/ murein hydrolase activator NlpD
MKYRKPGVELSSSRQRIPLASLLLILLTWLTPDSTAAQDVEFEAPYYLVQEGDSLWGISNRFGISLDELQTANDISDPNQLMIGMQLLIPGIGGVNGRVDSRQVIYGDTLDSLSRRYQISKNALIQLNRLTSPAELIAGSFVIVPVDGEVNESYQRIDIFPGRSLLELAVQYGKNPWVLMLENRLWRSWGMVPGSPLQTHNPAGRNNGQTFIGLPTTIKQIDITPIPLAQGKTMMIKVQAPSGLVLKGSFLGRELKFFPDGNGYVALQGIHTLSEPGAHPLSLEGQLVDGTNFAFVQSVLVSSVEYIYDPVLVVPPETVDPAVTEPEAALWVSLGEPVTLEKMWYGLFVSPVSPELSGCWTSFFGNRRAYNGSAYDYFHSGLDFCGRVGTELFAPAAGKVVFTDSLIVRGDVVVIDHGWGIYSAYDHLSDILVEPGEYVQPGQTIGLGGETGRTTGPHLHWEVWVGGIQVDPIDWLEQTYP